jgi:hypothetical protein
MKQYSSKKSDNFEELIQSLHQRINTLQSQYIGFVTFCTNLLNTHTSSIQKDLSNLSIKSIQTGVLKSLDSLKNSFEKATNDLGFSISSKNVQIALDSAQKQITSLCRLNQNDYEKKVSSMFVSLSEIINRKILKTRSKSRTQVNQPFPENSRNKMLSLQMSQKETQDFKEKIEKLEKKILSLNQELENKDRELERKKIEIENKNQEIFGFHYNNDVSRLTQKPASEPRFKLGTYDGIQINSVYASPVASPVLGDSRRRGNYGNSKNSPEKGFDLEKFKLKVEGLAGLLGKFNRFTALIDEAISANPELGELFLNFKSVKSELSFALMDMFDSRSPNKKKIEERGQDSIINNEIYSLKSENCKLKAEINHKNTEIIEITDQAKRLEGEVKEIRRSSMISKQDMMKVEKEKEEMQLEAIYLKSQIEKLQKTNKILTDNLLINEKKTTDFMLLQSKYDEIIKDMKLKPRVKLEIIKISTILIKSRKPALSIEFVDQIKVIIKKPSMFSSEILRESRENENSFMLNRKITQIISEKNKVEEELLLAKSKITSSNEENRMLNQKLSEALEMCKVFEEFLIKSENQSKKDNFSNLKVVSSSVISLPPNLKNIKKPPKSEKSLESRKNEEKISELEQILRLSKENQENLQKENKNLKKIQDKTQEELRQSEVIKSSLLSSNSFLEEKVHNLTKLLDSKQETSFSTQSTRKSLSFSEISQNFSSFSQEISEVFEKFSEILESFNLKLLSSNSQVFEVKENLLKKSKMAESLQNELKIVIKEKTKLLETRDKLITQCNAQSEEIISLKLEQEESFSQKKEDQDYEVHFLKSQVSSLQSTESSLLQALKETTDKYTLLLQTASEKDSKLESLTSELSQLKFKQSVKSLDSNDKYKEEVYSLKMKNIKLEQTIEDLRSSQLSQEEFSKVKSAYLCQISKMDEDRLMIEKKLKDSENSWTKEKEALQKSLDSFTKQLAGSTLETHNLKQKVKELSLALRPSFSSSDEYKIIRVVDHEDSTWFLLEVQATRQCLWTSSLPFENTEELKDPLPNLLKERVSLQKLNSELCIQNNKLRTIVSRVENLAKKENFKNILNILNEGKVEKNEIFEGRREDVKRNRPSRIARPGDVKTVSEMSDRASIESRKSNQSNKTSAFRIMLQDRDDELLKKNDFIRRQEIGLIGLKEENHRLREALERFSHLKILVGKLQSLNPKLNGEGAMVLRTMIALADQPAR